MFYYQSRPPHLADDNTAGIPGTRWFFQTQGASPVSDMLSHNACPRTEKNPIPFKFLFRTLHQLEFYEIMDTYKKSKISV